MGFIIIIIRGIKMEIGNELSEMLIAFSFWNLIWDLLFYLETELCCQGLRKI